MNNINNKKKQRENWSVKKGEERDRFKCENRKRGWHTLMPAPWHSVILMINVRSPVCFQHLEQQLNRDTEDKPSGRVTAERRPAPLMLKPCLFDMYYRSLILCKFEIRSPLNVVLPAATCPLKTNSNRSACELEWHLFTSQSRGEGPAINES